MLSSDQVRAARAILRWDQTTLAKAAGISVETIKRIEKIDGPLLAVTGTTIAAITAALTAAGILFLEEGQSIDGGPGVRLSKAND